MLFGVMRLQAFTAPRRHFAIGHRPCFDPEEIEHEKCEVVLR